MRKEIEDFEEVKKLYSFIESINFEFPQSYEEILKKYFDDLNISIVIGEGAFPIIERITVNKRVLDNKNIRINEVKHLKYPPKDYVIKYGRANLKEQSVFYGAFHFMTAVKEMKPEIGDLITVSKWKLRKENDKLRICPMFMKQPEGHEINFRLQKIQNNFMNKLKDIEPQLLDLFVDIHKFYANCFAKKIESNNNQDYIFTAFLADKILNQYYGGIVDAILYPSTQQNLTVENIAIKKDSFDEKYILTETIEKVLLYQSDDTFNFERLGESSTFINDKIIWN